MDKTRKDDWKFWTEGNTGKKVPQHNVNYSQEMKGTIMIRKEEMPLCDVATTVQLIGSKWKLLIIRDLIEGPKRPSTLKHSLSGISQKVLTESLHSMIDDGLVNRKELKKMPPHIEYELTALGETLLPVIESMRQWGSYYKSQI